MDIPIVIIGSGPVGTRVLRNIVRAKADAAVVVYGDEPWEPYDRVKLVSYLSGELAWADLPNLPPLPENHRVILHSGTRIVALDRQHQTVTDDQGNDQRYSKLLLATGSHPWIPDIPGTGFANVHTFRNVGDVRSLMDKGYPNRRVLILGGGLLGVEIACGLKKKGESVALVVSGRLLGRQLDEQAGNLVRAHLESLGIQMVFGRAREILGGEDIQGRQVARHVSLFDGQILYCDCVVLATGVIPTTELALSSGLATGRGVKVNDYLQTSDPLIFAAGECAEHAGRVYSLVGPGFEQADIVSQNLLGGRAKYHGSLIAAQLKGTDFPAFSCAREELDNVAESRTLTFEADAPKRYRALKLCKGRLMGAVGVGEWPEAWRIREAVLQNQRVSPAQSRSFLSCGNLWLDNMPSVAAWPKTATVCNCMGITKDLLDIAIEQGYTSIDELRKHTSAGTGCGSCLTLMAGLLDRPASLTSLEPDRRLLHGVSLLALILAMLSFIPAWPQPDTLQAGWRLDKLWHDNFWKQVSGYTLLALSSITLLMSLRKRSHSFHYLNYSSWRILHISLGGFVLLILALHTGLAFGHNLNQLLGIDFTVLALCGALTGIGVAKEGGSNHQWASRLRRWGYWGHVILFWPLPVLLAFHILVSYYF